MCMADKYRKTNKVGDSFAVAHCNFHLRAEESDGDQALVQLWCKENGIKCYVADFDTKAYAKENGISIEMAARDLRYNWFADLAIKEGFDAVAVAHNADDNVETLFLNLLRGTGAKGLRGMKEESTVPGHPDVPLIRPLLGTSRKEIEQYNSANGVPSRIDSTNLESDVKRNKIRNQVMPVFREINPSCLQTLSRDMSVFSQLSDIADELFLAKRHILVQTPLQGEFLRVDVKTLLSQKHWKYFLYRLLEEYGFSSGDLEAMCHLLEGGSTFSGKEFSSSSYRLITAKGVMIVTSKSQGTCVTESLAIEKDGTYSLGKVTFSCETITWDKTMQLKQPKGVLIADASLLQYPFIVRRWHEGDWMVPLGMKGKKKLSDLFVDLKLSKLDKETVLVVHSAGQKRTAAVLGLRIDDSLKVTDATSSVIRITINK